MDLVILKRINQVFDITELHSPWGENIHSHIVSFVHITELENYLSVTEKKQNGYKIIQRAIFSFKLLNILLNLFMQISIQ